MLTQSQTINGRTYTLYPLETYTTNPDFIIQLASVNGYPPSGGAPPVTVGKLGWAGNGRTTFNYAAFQIDNSSLGVYKDLTSALTALDAVLYP